MASNTAKLGICSICMSVIPFYCSYPSGFSTLAPMTFYNNHVITIIITAVDIVTVYHSMDHCDYFPCRELYVLISDFIIRMKPKPFPRALSDSFLEALPSPQKPERDRASASASISGGQRCKVYPSFHILGSTSLSMALGLTVLTPPGC